MYLEYTKSSRFIFSIMYQDNRSKRKNYQDIIFKYQQNPKIE